MSETETYRSVVAARDEVEAARDALEVARALVKWSIDEGHQDIEHRATKHLSGAELSVAKAEAKYVTAIMANIKAESLLTPKLPIENAMTLPPEGQSIWISVDGRGGLQISRQPNHAVMVAHWIDVNPPGMPEDCVWFYDHYEREDEPDANYGDPEDT